MYSPSTGGRELGGGVLNYYLKRKEVVKCL
jgi:hypothetical protein